MNVYLFASESKSSNTRLVGEMDIVAGSSYVQAVAGDRSAPIDTPFVEAGADIEEESSEGQEPLSRTIEAQTRNCEIDSIKSHPWENLPEGLYCNYVGIIDQRDYKRN
jgi:hypothetical protein